MSKPKEIGLPGWKFFEFVLFHLTPAGWRLKKLEKEGYLEFRRDKETGRIYVHPTEKTATLMAMRGVESCLECLEKPQIKSMRHHTFLTEIGMKLRESGYSDFRINPMCPHRPEGNIGTDALLLVGRCKIAILLETSDIGNRSIQVYRQEFRSYQENQKFDGVLYFNENLETMRFVIGYARIYDKIRFVDLPEFLTRGLRAAASAPEIRAGSSVKNYFSLMEIISDLRN